MDCFVATLLAMTARYFRVMPALGAGIHALLLPAKLKTWLAGHRRPEATPFFERLCPAMTDELTMACSKDAD
jgi:hypothetical protein